MDHANRGTGQVQPCPNFGPQLLVGIAGYCLVKVVFAGKVAVDVGASQSSTLGDLPSQCVRTVLLDHGPGGIDNLLAPGKCAGVRSILGCPYHGFTISAVPS